MAVTARFAEVLLPMLIFPMVTPVLVAGVASTGIARHVSRFSVDLAASHMGHRAVFGF